MSQKQIIVIVNPDGNISIEASGFKGPACAKATAALEEAMGKVTTKKKTPEWHQETVGHQKVG